ncbi:uncharacterized protein [Parasteatoda tepidariorum]|nr:uncharacterized protein LOC122268369 [Parasteatoda tepidariorum]
MDDSEQTENGPIPKNDDLPSSPARTCALCGCSTPAVRCDRCSSQTFCLSCDDMYHRHPKRRLHLRKAVDSIWSSTRSPRLRRRTELPGDPSKIPIPPPRSKKRERHERHTIAGRMFLRPGLELGSFGHSKMFDKKNVVYAKPRLSPNTAEGTYENEGSLTEPVSPNILKNDELYENDSVARNQGKSLEISPSVEERPWNSPQPNLSPIQVSIPSSTPDLIGPPLGYPPKSHSRSITDIPNAAMSPGGHHHPYHFPHPYPYMHPPVHQPYSQSMAHLNCSQCMSASWTNLMSPHPSPYFHPMPWGPPHAGMPQNGASHTSHGTLKHNHGDLGTYPDPSFHYPYPGGVFYPNGFPTTDPNNTKDLPQQASGSAKVRRSSSTSRSPRQAQSTEDLPLLNNPTPESSTNETNGITRKSSVDIAKPADVDEESKPPVPPSEPWGCLHCTFINPPGIYICQVCCKTSYGNKPPGDEEDMIDSPAIDRNSESPMELVNMDAEISSKFSKLSAQKVI